MRGIHSEETHECADLLFCVTWSAACVQSVVAIDCMLLRHVASMMLGLEQGCTTVQNAVTSEMIAVHRILGENRRPAEMAMCPSLRPVRIA